MAHDLRLPATIISPADLARAKRNLDTHNELQHQADLRAASTGSADSVHAGRVISELSVLNELDLNDANARTQLLELVEEAVQLAPVITMSFAVDPSAEFMAKIVDWLRATIHPQILVRIGLQPSIAAGFTMRTSSKIYDFSLRQRLLEQRSTLVEHLRKAGQQAAPAPVQAASPAPEAVATVPTEAAPAPAEVAQPAPEMPQQPTNEEQSAATPAPTDDQGQERRG